MDLWVLAAMTAAVILGTALGLFTPRPYGRGWGRRGTLVRGRPVRLVCASCGEPWSPAHPCNVLRNDGFYAIRGGEDGDGGG